jgi:hypothetical protein
MSADGKMVELERGKRKGDEVADEEQGGRKKYECKSEKKYFKMRLF